MTIETELNNLLIPFHKKRNEKFQKEIREDLEGWIMGLVDEYEAKSGKKVEELVIKDGEVNIKFK